MIIIMIIIIIIINIYLFIYRFLIFPRLSVPKVLIFSSPPFSVDPFQVVNFPISHSCCNFLHPGISRSSFSSSSRWTLFQSFSRQPFLIHSQHVAIPVQLLVFYIISNKIFNTHFSLITLFLIFYGLDISPISSKSPFPST